MGESYYENQIDNLILNGLNQYDEFVIDLNFRLEKYIIDNGYDWTIEGIVKEYREKYSKGYYVSHSCKKIIEHFKEDLIKSTGIKPLNNG